MLLGMLLALFSSQANAIEVGDYLPLGQIQSIQGESLGPNPKEIPLFKFGPLGAHIAEHKINTFSS